jgi:hypothetical protein
MPFTFFNRNTTNAQPSSHSIPTTVELPPQYDTLNDDNIFYQQLTLEKNKVILDKIKMEIQMIDAEIESHKQIKLLKQQQLNKEINEIRLISERQQTEKNKLLDKQKQENIKIIKMMENENTKFIDNMTQLKEKQLELFQNTEWIEKNIEEIIPISIEKISPTALSQSEINELYKSCIDRDISFISWENLSETKKDIWNMRALSYMKQYGESIDGKTLHSRCKNSGYSSDYHTRPCRLHDGTILPCKCMKCIWAKLALKNI